MGWLCHGSDYLVHSKPGYPYHPNITITPGLVGNPLNQVISICSTLHPWISRIRMTKASGVPDDMNITSGGKKFGIATLCGSTPKGGPSRLVIARLHDLRTLQELIVTGKG